MKVAIVALGTRGDVHPMLAFAQGLSGAGYDVRLVTHEPFRDLVTRLGLAFAPTQFDTRAFLNDDPGQQWLDSGENPVRFILRLRRAVLPALPSILAELRAATAGADVVVGPEPGLLDGTLAEAAGAKLVRTSLVPLARTRAFPNITAMPLNDFGGPLNAATHPIAYQIYWQIFRAEIQKWRRSLGLAPLPPYGPYRRFERERVPVLNAFSPLVVPPPSDWPAWHHITGYWTFDDPDEAAPPQGLAAFLDAGPAPVYVGFGSMTPRNARDLTSLVRAALRKGGRRGVLLTGWGGLSDDADPGGDNLFVVERISHRWLLPRTLAAVHHGGAGTTAAAIIAGVPSVVIPFFSDQRFWGGRVARLGLGPPPIQRQRLTIDGLAAAIEIAASEPVRTRAALLGGRVAAETGVANAAELFRRYAG